MKRTKGFWPGFWDGLALGPLWRMFVRERSGAPRLTPEQLRRKEEVERRARQAL